eukprot:TRINITY_DN577_c1_g1_i1.p2 TRINITY_DN577_c1_g1~~TRINITY_DN577_c1_g1_i1.p2  ORF type:complete len:106 (+),score=1.07 TRINITY_DN577_c1_g1_i1:58-375(+)
MGNSYSEYRDQNVDSHIRHELGHRLNARLKDSTGGRLRLDWLYPDRKPWDADLDRKRAADHHDEGCRLITENLASWGITDANFLEYDKVLEPESLGLMMRIKGPK